MTRSHAFSRPGRHSVALAVVAALAVLATTAVEARSAPSCLRGGATLVAADGKTRVVRVRETPRNDATRREAILSCWAPTGQRRTIAREQDQGLDTVMRTRVHIVDGRWVGVIVQAESGVSESVVASVHDARRRREVHDTSECEYDRGGDLWGVDDVVFLPDGGIAFSCQRLLLYRDRDAREARELEPQGTFIRNLAVTRYHHGHSARLYWTTGMGETERTKSYKLG